MALMGLSTPCHLLIRDLSDGPTASSEGRFSRGKSSK